jgi:hypothetical protein
MARMPSEVVMTVTKVLLLGFAIALAGCAASGVRYSNHAAVTADLARDSTRITVFRTEQHSTYGGRAASVRVDGRFVGGCEYAGYVVFFVPPGPHVLAVDMVEMPGTCSVAADVLGGEDYYYEIEPRPESYVAGVVGNVLDALGGGLLVGTLGALSAESAGKRCGGAFAIRPVAEEKALAELVRLRASK